MSLKENFLDIIAHGASVTALCNALEQELETPVAVILPTRTITNHSQGYTKELIEEFTQATKLYTTLELKEYADQLHRNIMSRKAFSGIYPYTMHKRINCGCFWHGSLISILDIPLVGVSESEELLALVEEAAAVFTAALIVNHGIPTENIDPMETYMISLLYGQVLPEYQQSFSYGIRFSQIKRWRAVWARPVEPKGLKGLSTKLYAFCSKQKDIWCTKWADGLAVLLDAEVVEKIQAYKENCPSAYFVISEEFLNVLDFSKVLTQLQGILSLVEHIGNQEELVFAQKYKIPFLFLAGAQRGEVSLYESPLMKAVRSHDNTTADLEKTIRSYILNNMNVGKVSRELNLHKNTVIYRLQKFTELTGADLTDSSVITELYLALFTDMLLN